MEVIGYIAAIAMGAVLGLVGGGGSILTVPIFVYLFAINSIEATGYSLFVVGVSSLIGSIGYIRRGLVNFRVGFFFSLPAFLGVYLVRRYGLPAMPDTLAISQLVFSKESLILFTFSLIMLAASYSMIKGGGDDTEDSGDKRMNYFLVVVEGLVVGSITGFVGAGGGFLIIPALVVLAGLKMKVAVGTSLLVIGIKSLFGFVGDMQVLQQIDWRFLAQFTMLSLIGISLGLFFAKKIPGKKLKPAFGWFVLLMGLFVLSKQIF